MLKVKLNKDEINVLLTLVSAKLMPKNLIGAAIRDQQIKTYNKLCTAYVMCQKVKAINFNYLEMLLLQNAIRSITMQLDPHTNMVVIKISGLIDKIEKSL